MTIYEALEQTNWPMLTRQKSSLLAAIDYAESLNRLRTKADLEGLLHWIDAIQDAAENEGFRVFQTRRVR